MSCHLRCHRPVLALLVLFAPVAVLSGARNCAGPHSPLPNGTLLPCGPGNEFCPFNCTRDDDGCDAFALLAPWKATFGYHIRDLTCGLNDPNGPVFDARHGVYHLVSEKQSNRPRLITMLNIAH